MSTFLLVKANDEWAIFSQLQKPPISFQTDDVQEYYALNDSLSGASKAFQTISQSDFEPPYHIVNNWPAVGFTYHYISMPTPFDITIKQGEITEEILQEYNEGSSGNMFETYEQAEIAARKLTKFFETT